MVSGMALGCGPAREGRTAPRDFSVEGLRDAIGAARAEDAIGIVAEAREHGVPIAQVLAATWLAPLSWGGLPGDVHAVLVLPAIDRLVQMAAAPGGDRWLTVCWAVVNTTAWCRDARIVLPAGPARVDRAALVSAIRAGDEAATVGAAIGLCTRDGDERAIAVVAEEALEPRADVHAAIYAAQALRFAGAIPLPHRSAVIAHVARYLSRGQTLGVEVRPIAIDPAGSASARDVARVLAEDPWAPVDGASEAAIVDALALLATAVRAGDGTISGNGVHTTTHLDAVLHLARRSSPASRPRALACAVRSVVRERIALDAAPPAAMRGAGDAAGRDLPRFRHGVGEALVRHAADEHSFKYWAALDTLRDVVSPDLHATLWSGAGLLDAARREALWPHRAQARTRLGLP
jgi:hypothetical protein